MGAGSVTVTESALDEVFDGFTVKLGNTSC